MGDPSFYRLELDGFARLFSSLQEDGYHITAPTIQNGAIVYDDIHSVEQLPIGWTDEQAPGHYRIKQRQDRAYFGYNASPHSWKKYLFPPKQKLWEASRSKGKLQVLPNNPPVHKRVFLGVRSCEMEAIFIQDKVFIEGEYVDPHYKAQRDNTLIVAVNCTQAASTCFCVSMDSGPKTKRGYDLSLTEVISEGEHYFVVNAGTEAGDALLAKAAAKRCADEEIASANRSIGVAEAQMRQGLGMETSDIKELLYRNVNSTRWDDVASRCLSCGNCTLACPTCFCSDVTDTTDLTGDHTERWRSWSSCFNHDHSELHGGAVRNSTQSRYRQWLTHKLGSWIDQYGTSGCTGCGRCVAWCPVGIDIREEVAALRLLEEGDEQT